MASVRLAFLRSERSALLNTKVFGISGERSGVSPKAIEAADAVVAVPMLGMANSLNVATAAILLYWLTVRFEKERDEDE